MASVITFPAGRSFRLCVKKHLTQNPAVRWENVYWLYSLSAGTQADLEAMAAKMGGYEAYFHLPIVWIDSVRVSTGAHDSDPYDPNTFFIHPINLPGARSGTASDAEPLTMTLNVSRAVPSGRLGVLHYRGALVESDVVFGGKLPALTNAALWQSLIDGAVASVGLDDYFDGGASTMFRLVLVTTNGSFIRYISGLQVSGAGIVSATRRWHNRSTAPSEGPDFAEPDLGESETWEPGIDPYHIIIRDTPYVPPDPSEEWGDGEGD